MANRNFAVRPWYRPAGTSMVTLWSSVGDVPPLQSLVGLVPGGIVPVHVTCTVWPGVTGTTSEWEGGSEARTGHAANVVAVNPTTPMLAHRSRIHRLMVLPPQSGQWRKASRGVGLDGSR